MTNTASWAAEDAEQVALIAAHAGTAVAVGAEVGLGEASEEGLGDGIEVGVGVGLAAREGDELGRAAEVPQPHAASASSAASANTPSLTGS